MLDKLINQTWRTNTEVITNNQGTISFRGFFGEYEIKLNYPEGGIKVYKVHINKNEENNWTFIID